ncbi:MAG: class GN sortase [Pikeienuella sp.]
MIPAKRIGTGLAVALLVFGCMETAKGSAGPIKAAIGQWLLDAAWSETLTSGTPAKPWSWADIRPVARIAAPRIGAEAVVLDMASGEAMAWGPGHVRGTAELGAPGLAAIAGHRDSHLAFLADLRPGDELVLSMADGQDQRYKVSHALVVDARAWRLPARRSGPSTLALTTCWPFDAQEDGPLRFVLFAEAQTEA